MTHSRRKLTIIGAAATALFVPLIGASPAHADGPVEAGVTVPIVENLPEDFINGVDVSSVLALEQSGVVFRDDSGAPADLFEVLAEAGVTDVRVRVWNDPFDELGRGYGGGNTDVATAVEIGQRATTAGLRLLINFHYSDFWADPGKQMAPKAWQGLDVSQTAAAVAEFTTDALAEFLDAGVDVRMVQVGNETNNAVAGHSGWEAMTEILQAGSTAVRTVMPDALVAVHFTNPETTGRYETAARELADAGVDYDVFASSYYPFWHGSLDNLTTVLSQVATEHDKLVMVTETSWVHTLADGDGHPNTIDNASQATMYPVSVQGQASAVRDVIEAVVEVGDAGIGVFYWEPAWLPVGPPSELEANQLLWEEFGSGWATSFASGYDPDDAGQWYGGTSWDNQALFDFDGHPLESLHVFAYARTGTISDRVVTMVEHPDITVTEGDDVSLPTTVRVDYSDGSFEDQPVTWTGTTIDGPGTYEIPGVTDQGLETSARVTVLAPNFLLNGGFEDADVSMWELVGTGATLHATDDPRSGSRSAHFYSDSPFAFTLSQTVSDLAAGSYRASAALQGDGAGGDSIVELTLSGTSGSSSAAFAMTGWQNWSLPQTDPVEVGPDGALTVTITVDLPAGAWGTIDDVALVLVEAAEPEPSPSPGPTVTVTVTASPTTPAPPQPGDVYSTPGFHNSGGRWWHTQCEPYSQTIRCRTEIWSSINGVGGWAFNNLTYLPFMTRAQWAANPLGHDGTWTAADGRRWRTECDTPATGRNGCRSYTWSATSGWVFNNIVRFRI